MFVFFDGDEGKKSKREEGELNGLFFSKRLILLIEQVAGSLSIYHFPHSAG